MVTDQSKSKGSLIVLAHVAAFAAALIWSANFTLIKIARDELDPVAMYLLRYGIAALFAASIWLFRKPKLSGLSWKSWLVIAALAAMVGPIYQVLLIYGAAGTSAGLMGMLIATQSLHIGWQAPLVLREHASARQIVALILGMVGVCLPIIWAGDFSFEAIVYPGVIAIAALLSGFNTVIPRRMRDHLHPLDLMPSIVILAVLLSIPLINQSSITQWRELSFKGWMILIYIGSIGLPLAHLLWYFCVHNITAVTAAFYFFVMMALSAAWGMVLLDEPFIFIDAVAIAVILAGLLLNAKARSANSSPDAIPD